MRKSGGVIALVVSALCAGCAAQRLPPSAVVVPSRPVVVKPAQPQTVDAIPVDDARLAFVAMPATRSAAKKLESSSRPAATTATRMSVPADLEQEPGVVVPAEAMEAPAALPAPTLPTRRVPAGAEIPAASEGALLRGETPNAPAVVPPSAPAVPPPAVTPPVAPPVAPPVEPEPKPAPPAPPPPPPPPPSTAPSAPPATEPATQPAPTEPAPTQPAPTQPAPTQPAPTQPAPETPAVAPEPLGLRNPTLASRVRGFGDLTAIQPAVLSAGDRLIAYFELAGWTTVAQPDGRFVTEVNYTVQVIDAEGVPTWSDQPQRAQDISRTQRNDLFVTRLVRLPETLTPGKYALRIVAEDGATQDKTTATVPFDIEAEPSK